MSRKTGPRLGTGLLVAMTLLLVGACGGNSPLAPEEEPSAIATPEEPQARAPEAASGDERPDRPSESDDAAGGLELCFKECF